MGLATRLSPGSGCSGRPGWTTQRRWDRCARWHGTWARSWRGPSVNDYYGILGIRRDAGPDEIKKAYRRLARELHPDVNPDPQTQERVKEITQAYEGLSHPEKRQMDDPGGEPVARSFLGQVMTSRPCPACGGYGTIIRRPCPECDADGRVRTRRTIKVRIPAGVVDGTHIQLAGEGEVGPGGGPPGDLFLEIVQRPHAIFERQGDDPHCTVTIPLGSAAPGATLSVESLDGPADIDIRPGTQSGQVIPLYGQGVRHLNGNGRGDLVIHVTVETPVKLDAEQEKLLRDLAKLRGE